MDGEVVALDENRRPSFNLLQTADSGATPIAYFVFDVLVLSGRNVMTEPLVARQELVRTRILPRLAEPIRYAPPLDSALSTLVSSAR